MTAADTIITHYYDIACACGCGHSARMTGKEYKSVPYGASVRAPDCPNLAGRRIISQNERYAVVSGEGWGR